MRRWPLFFVALSASAAIWSGWVALGGLCGFGPVNLLPGIGGGFTINTAITLPVGAEAYAAFAVGAYLSHRTPARARVFARRSAVAALLYGMAGQVIYHLLAAAHVAAAPWPVVVLVSCMPVAVLGFAAGLAHLLRAAGDSEDVAGERSQQGVSSSSRATRPGPVPSSAFEAAKARMRQAADLGFRYTDNQARADFGLTRTVVTEARNQVTSESPAGGPPHPSPAGASGQDAGRPAGVLAAQNGHGTAGG